MNYYPLRTDKSTFDQLINITSRLSETEINKFISQARSQGISEDDISEGLRLLKMR